MDPKINNFNIYTIFPVICAFFYALTMIIQKKTSREDSLYSQVFHIYIFAILTSLIMGFVIGSGNYNDPSNEHLQFIFRAWSINNINIIFLLFIMGVCGFVAFLCIFQAYRIGSPPSVAPFEYVLIPLSLIFSWVIWKESLSFKGYIGLGFIVFGGIYTFYRESKKNVQITIDKPLRR